FDDHGVAFNAHHFHHVAHTEHAVVNGLCAPVIATNGHTAKSQTGVEILGDLAALAHQGIHVGPYACAVPHPFHQQWADREESDKGECGEEHQLPGGVQAQGCGDGTTHGADPHAQQPETR